MTDNSLRAADFPEAQCLHEAHEFVEAHVGRFDAELLGEWTSEVWCGADPGRVRRRARQSDSAGLLGKVPSHTTQRSRRLSPALLATVAKIDRQCR
ncbi:MAG: hypothetical protein LC808_31025 [Actinobacteria bacterium]|nr:hypothetical protein [Actinomycetota bacterium]